MRRHRCASPSFPSWHTTQRSPSLIKSLCTTYVFPLNSHTLPLFGAINHPTIIAIYIFHSPNVSVSLATSTRRTPIPRLHTTLNVAPIRASFIISLLNFRQMPCPPLPARPLVVKWQCIFQQYNVIYIYIDPPRPLSLPEERSFRGFRNVAISRPPPFYFTYTYGGSLVLHFPYTSGFPQAIPLLPILTTAAYHRHFLLPILAAAADIDATVTPTSAPSCFAISNHVRYCSGSPTFINPYGGKLHCHHRSPSSAPSFCAFSNNVRHCHFYNPYGCSLCNVPLHPRQIFLTF
jgi:hypothetical protein